MSPGKLSPSALRIDPRWIKDVSESAKAFAKAVEEFKKGADQIVRAGLVSRAPTLPYSFVEDDGTEQDDRRRESAKLQMCWRVVCVDCGEPTTIDVTMASLIRGLFEHIEDVGEISDSDEAIRHVAEGLAVDRIKARGHLTHAGWTARGCGRWIDNYRCAACTKKAGNG